MSVIWRLSFVLCRFFSKLTSKADVRGEGANGRIYLCSNFNRIERISTLSNALCIIM